MIFWLATLKNGFLTVVGEDERYPDEILIIGDECPWSKSEVTLIKKLDLNAIQSSSSSDPKE